ncbi:MAG: DUF5689 domain-containing protein [Flavobacteriaceae bacterium]
MYRAIIVPIFCLLANSCGLQTEFSVPDHLCNDSLVGNIGFDELKELLGNERVIEIYNDLRIEGYVISSDKSGNFFRSLHLQDMNSEPSGGVQVEVDFTDLHLLFPVGTRVLVDLKGLYLGRSNGIYKIGSATNNFGTLGISRLPGLAAQKHISYSCGDRKSIKPTKITIDSLTESLINTLVELENLEFVTEELGETYALHKEETYRTLHDCLERAVRLRNSGYSDFQAEMLPEGRGRIRGLLHKEGKDYVLIIRDTSDIDFVDNRCSESRELFTTAQVFISEIADPENETDARFVELYNSGPEDIPLNSWTLRRYTNGNTEIGSSVLFTGQVIESNKTFVIAADSSGFEHMYGFKPDLVAGSNSAADSNGDDNLELADPFNNIIDRFGLPGEDGSGTNHEFEDGGAFRRPEITMGRPEYLFEEWIIFNDSGESGTIRQALLAPEDFTPGER